MLKTTRREIRSMLHTVETQLPRSRDYDRYRDLFAQAGIHIWEGKPGRLKLVKCITRLGELLPEPMAPVIERLFSVLTKGEPRPEPIEVVDQTDGEIPADPDEEPVDDDEDFYPVQRQESSWEAQACAG